MGIRSAMSEGIECRHPGKSHVPVPCGFFGTNVKRRFRQFDQRIELFEMQLARELLMLQGQQNLDQPGHSRSRRGMTNMRFHTAYCAVSRLLSKLSKSPHQSIDFHRIA